MHERKTRRGLEVVLLDVRKLIFNMGKSYKKGSDTTALPNKGLK